MKGRISGLFSINNFFKCVSILPVCMSVQHVHAVPTEVTRVSDSLESELQMVLSHYVGAGN